MRVLQILVVLLIISQVAWAYQDYSLSIKTIVDKEGNAHIIQKTVLFLENDNERKTFDFYFNSAQFTLLEWQRFSKTINYYFKGGVSNLTILAALEPNVGFNAVSVVLEYNVDSLMISKPTGPRSSTFVLDTSRIALANENGEFGLGNKVDLIISLPANSFNVKPVPQPTLREGSELTWKGPLKGRFSLSYEVEKPLGEEVSEFFVNLQKDAANFYLLALGFALVGFLVFKYFETRRY
ncbi:hypothetical protein HUU53_01975 [Candidatus Micrarchaeota archaeon]|nr:hypothetical protein [Candidatus Micrarchaeota archaeon]